MLLLVLFLFNVVGQLWEPLDWVRRLTLFYYYQPQEMILKSDWYTNARSSGAGWRLPLRRRALAGLCAGLGDVLPGADLAGRRCGWPSAAAGPPLEAGAIRSSPKGGDSSAKQFGA